MIGMNYRIPAVDSETCRACSRCLARTACKLKALVQFDANELPYVNRDLCRGCLDCVEKCPFGAITIA